MTVRNVLVLGGALALANKRKDMCARMDGSGALVHVPWCGLLDRCCSLAAALLITFFLATLTFYTFYDACIRTDLHGSYDACVTGCKI
jgi:hypothetical protein